MSDEPMFTTGDLDVTAPTTCWKTVWSARCDVGCARRDNQDRIGHAIGPFGEVFVVADGVGGEAGGAAAAELAVETYANLSIFRPQTPGEAPAAALQRATALVTHRIEAARQSQPSLAAMATTAAVVFLTATSVGIGHIGDSRIYLCRAGAVQLVTTDHSVVQRMVSEGVLSAEEAKNHPSGHILTRSLGQQDAQMDVATLELQPNDLLLLCSDGLWATVPFGALAEELARVGTELDTFTQALLQRTLAAGAPDNVSIVAIRILPDART
ncbi:MAG: PP2C family protein-serine/threonine phosphatase [Janthinobacterium lividum]